MKTGVEEKKRELLFPPRVFAWPFFASPLSCFVRARQTSSRRSTFVRSPVASLLGAQMLFYCEAWSHCFQISWSNTALFTVAWSSEALLFEQWPGLRALNPFGTLMLESGTNKPQFQRETLVRKDCKINKTY